jgi:hypothetical protein
MSFEGEIGEIDLIERLVELGGEQFTGAIRFESDGIIKIVYFKSGDVLSASTNDRTDAIDEILQRAGKVTREHIKQALAKRKESETLGDALLGLGFITRKELTWARRVQVIGIIRSIIGWSTGSYTIVADYLPKREEGTFFSLAQIIVELVVTDNDRAKSEQAMDSGNAVFEKTPNFDDAFRRLGLNEDAEQIVAQIDGRNSAAEVASRSGKDIFNVYKLLEALRLLHLVTRSDKPPVEHEVSLPASSNPWDVENPDFTLDDDVPPPVVEAPQEEWGLSPEDATMELPEVNLAAWEAAKATPATLTTPPTPAPTPSAVTSKSVWDEPEEDDRFSGTELAPPLPASVSAAALGAEPQWGFDEAQIEAARRAAVPVRAKDEVPSSVKASASKPPRKSRAGLWIAILVLLLLGGAAYPAWQWWQDRNAPAPIIPVKRAKLRNAGVPPAGPGASSPRTVATTSTVPMPPLAAKTSTSPITPVKTTNTPSAAQPQSSATTTAAQKAPSHAATATTAPAPPPQVAKNTPPQKQPPPAATTTAAPRTLPRTAAAAITPVPQPASTAPSTPHLERTAAGAPTITNTPGNGAPVNDATRAKYDTMAKDFAARKGGTYTVQFELVCETASITRALSDGGDKAWFVPISYRGRPCYRVFWGRFDTSAEAINASKTMPSGLSKAPVVVKIPR